MDCCELRRADRVSAGRAAKAALTGVVAVRVTASEQLTRTHGVHYL